MPRGSLHERQEAVTYRLREYGESLAGTRDSSVTLRTGVNAAIFSVQTRR
jgi:hypothetical protein